MLTRLLLVLSLVMLIGGGGIVRADDSGTRDAKRHFERGEKLYALAKFREALDEYQQAFDAKPIAAFLFNIGQCYRNLEDYDAAIFSYRKYLRLAPDAANRDKVEQLIAELDVKRDRANTERLGLATRPPPEPTPVPAPILAPAPAPPPRVHEEHHPFYTRWWFWTGVVVVGAAGGLGTYEATRSSGGPPGTGLGNIVFGK
ncbi:MAG TPA: tetratricopeptide repeat protein [Kofleriaceae bacterium]